MDFTSIDDFEVAYNFGDRILLTSAIGENRCIERLTMFVDGTSEYQQDFINLIVLRLADNSDSCMRELNLIMKNDDGDEGLSDYFMAVGRLVQVTRSLQHLYFENYMFQPESMASLLLKESRQLSESFRKLSLKNCKISRDATSSLVEYMQRPHTNRPALRELNFDECTFIRANHMPIVDITTGSVLAAFFAREPFDDPFVMKETIGSQLNNLSMQNTSFLGFLECAMNDPTIVKMPALTVREFESLDNKNELESLTELLSAVTWLRELSLEIDDNPCHLDDMVSCFKVNGSICKLSITCSQTCRALGGRALKLLPAYSMRNEHLSGAFSIMPWFQNKTVNYNVHDRKKIRRTNTTDCDSIASTLNMFPSLLQASKHVPRTASSNLLKNLLVFQTVAMVDDPV